MTQGRMLRDVRLLGTGLKLWRGQRVMLLRATNLPQGGYFASPIDGGVTTGTRVRLQWGENSIHLDDSELGVTFTIDRKGCKSCGGKLSDKDERHGYQTCSRCVPGHVPTGSRYSDPLVQRQRKAPIDRNRKGGQP